MAYQKKNLLEAFQASAAADKAKAQGTAPSDASPGAQAPPGESTVAGSPPRIERRAPAAPVGAGPLSRLIVLQLVITVAAFFLGRFSVSSVDAGEPGGDGPQGAGAAARGERSGVEPGEAPASSGQGAALEVDPEPGTPAERALVDVRNRYTVKVVEYRKGVDDALAAETLAWLQSQGLPAAAQFRGSRLYILVGAAPRSSELEELAARARTIDGPPPLRKKAEFSDAYIEQIDKLIDR